MNARLEEIAAEKRRRDAAKAAEGEKRVADAAERDDLKRRVVGAWAKGEVLLRRAMHETNTHFVNEGLTIFERRVTDKRPGALGVIAFANRAETSNVPGTCVMIISVDNRGIVNLSRKILNRPIDVPSEPLAVLDLADEQWKSFIYDFAEFVVTHAN